MEEICCETVSGVRPSRWVQLRRSKTNNSASLRKVTVNHFLVHALRVRALLICAALLITAAAMAGPVKVQSVTLIPTSVKSGQPARGTINLTPPAGWNHGHVTLTSPEPTGDSRHHRA